MTPINAVSYDSFIHFLKEYDCYLDYVTRLYMEFKYDLLSFFKARPTTRNLFPMTLTRKLEIASQDWHEKHPADIFTESGKASGNVMDISDFESWLDNHDSKRFWKEVHSRYLIDNFMYDLKRTKVQELLTKVAPKYAKRHNDEWIKWLNLNKVVKFESFN